MPSDLIRQYSHSDGTLGVHSRSGELTNACLLIWGESITRATLTDRSTSLVHAPVMASTAVDLTHVNFCLVGKKDQIWILVLKTDHYARVLCIDMNNEMTSKDSVWNLISNGGVNIVQPSQRLSSTSAYYMDIPNLLIRLRR